jgi:DNA-binding response OmpR family regulator
MSKVLLVEDEQDLAEQIKDWLEDENFLVEMVSDGDRALDMLRVYKYDVVILDWMLPGSDGAALCRRFRAAGGTTPIIMLTAKPTLEDKEVGFRSGADDYLTKPFQLKELSVRLKALIRRSTLSFSSSLEVRDVVLDPDARTVTKNGAQVHLEPKEFNLLEFLMRNKNKTFSAEALIQHVWESGTLTTADTLRGYVKSIRRKIDTAGQTSLIVTVYGIGYKIEEP